MAEIIIGIVILWIFNRVGEKKDPDEYTPYMYDHFDNWDDSDSDGE